MAILLGRETASICSATTKSALLAILEDSDLSDSLVRDVARTKAQNQTQDQVRELFAGLCEGIKNKGLLS